MADGEDDAQKTEEPTPKRIEEAHKRGQVAYSREVTSLLMLILLTLAIVWMMPGVMRTATGDMARYIGQAHSYSIEADNIRKTAADILWATVKPMALFLLAALVVAFAGSMLQNQLRFATDPITPKLSKISPIAGFKRLFSRRSLVEFVKGIIKISLVGMVGTAAVWPYRQELLVLPTMGALDTLALITAVAVRMLIGMASMLFIIAVLDVLYQRFEHTRSLRMTKQEIKDEYKQQEGDPIVKQRLRSIRMERARKRMMAAVPEADVVITNPTHFAVALKYEQGTMAAPRLVAKGADRIAQRIREVAEEHKVPIVENPPLARALFSGVELEQEIPTEHYQAVAQVIGYVYRLKGKFRQAPGEKS